MTKMDKTKTYVLCDVRTTFFDRLTNCVLVRNIVKANKYRNNCGK